MNLQQIGLLTRTDPEGLRQIAGLARTSPEGLRQIAGLARNRTVLEGVLQQIQHLA